jgi:hypothetical protein
MKTAKLTLICLACAAALPAFAQNTTDSRCGATNYDRARDMYTIVRSTNNVPNQQCFITVVPKASWQGGANDPSTSQFIEGNYQITLAGAGGGGGAAGQPGSGSRGKDGGAGSGAQDANTSTVSRYLSPGIYRVTLGAGGMGGTSGARSVEGAPSSLSNTATGETVAGFAGAENWRPSAAGTTGGPASGGSAASGTTAAGGDGGAAGSKNVTPASGAQGGAGFMKLALVDAVQPRAAAPVPQAAFVAAAPAPAYVEPARAAPVAVRPAKKDRN